LSKVAKFCWLVLSVLFNVTEPLFVEPDPFPVFETLALAPVQQPLAEVFRFPKLEIVPVEVASPVLIVVSPPVFPLSVCP
jgi:hypothetical protein